MNQQNEQQPTATPSNPYMERIKSFDQEALTTDPEPAKFIWQGVPDEPGKVSVLVGVGGTGKSALTLGLATARALGRDFMGRKTKPGTTVIISKEDSRADYRRKLAAQRFVLGDQFDPQRIEEHVFVMDVLGDPAMLVASGYGNSADPNTELVKHWTDAINTAAPAADLIILETGSRLTPSEDNSGLSALVTACESLGLLTGCVVVLVHHTGKEAGRNGFTDLYTGRGGSSLADNARAVMVLTNYPQDKTARERLGVAVPEEVAPRALVLSVPKQNGAPPPPPLLIEKIATPWALTMREIDGEALARAGAAAHKVRVSQAVRALAEAVEAATEAGQTVTRRSITKREVEGIDPETFPKEFLAEVLAQALACRALIEEPGTRKGHFVLRADPDWFLNQPAANEEMADADRHAA
ncbi:MAG: AAA family ATPase [Anaeromyxobacteraceae bacterium]